MSEIENNFDQERTGVFQNESIQIQNIRMNSGELLELTVTNPFGKSQKIEVGLLVQNGVPLLVSKSHPIIENTFQLVGSQSDQETELSTLDVLLSEIPVGTLLSGQTLTLRACKSVDNSTLIRMIYISGATPGYVCSEIEYTVIARDSKSKEERVGGALSSPVIADAFKKSLLGVVQTSSFS